MMPPAQRSEVQSAGLQLADDELLFATWRPRTVKPRPAIRPFEREAAVRALIRANRGPRCSWSETGITAAISREEALFWLHSAFCTHRFPGLNRDELRRRSAEWDIERVPEEGEVTRELDKLLLAPAILTIIERLYGWDSLLRFVRQVDSAKAREYFCEYDDTFRRGLLPYLGEAELEPLREAIAPRLAGRTIPRFLLPVAGLIGMPEQVRNWLAGASRHIDWGLPARAIYFGLSSAEEVFSRREWLGFPQNEIDVVGWLAHTGVAHLEWLSEGMGRLTPAAARQVVKAMAARITGPEGASHFLTLMEKGHGAAGEWLLADPERTARGLDGHSWDLKNKAGRALAQAADALKLRLCAAAAKPAEHEPQSSQSLPEALERELARARALRVRLPKWLSLDRLPEVRLHSGQFRDVAALCASLSTFAVNPLGDDPLAAALRAHADAESLDRFAGELFEMWRNAGMPPKERWALGAVGLLGGEPSALAIIPHIRGWPAKSRYVAAELGYQVLLKIYTPQVLWETRTTIKTERAAQFYESAAIRQGLTAEQLDDRLLPKPPQISLDFGSRRFEVRLGPEARLVLIEDNGARHDKLPKPKRADDPALAEAAAWQWKMAEKEFALIRKFALARLESAWKTLEGWTIDEFEKVLLRHPVYEALSRLCVWGCFDQQQRCLGSFRVTEDRHYSGVEDRDFSLPEATCRIGLVSASQLSGADLTRWARIFDDYNLIPLFAQMETPAAFPDGLLRRSTLSLYGSFAFETLERNLAKLGYKHMTGEGWSKSFGGGGTTIVNRPAARSSLRTAAASVAPEVFFFDASGMAVTAGELDPAVVSQIMLDLAELDLTFQHTGTPQRPPQ
jgi:hypothetical protein